MSLPFYVISSGDESTDGNTTDTPLSGSSHDTSRARYHIQDVESFAIELNDAAKSAFPNWGRSRYETVNACLIRWEEDELLVDRELERLGNVFQGYGFMTKEWQIPTKNSHLDLMIKTAEFIRDADNNKNLFIVYYAGHGRINNERQAEWTCRRDPSYARVHWSAIQTLFAEAQSDVLILLDTCAAASATARSLHGSMEAIMACGFESIAPPPGEHSFTNTLIDVLEDWIDRLSFSASCLHAEILSQLKLKENKKGREGKKLEWCVTPIHINCTQDAKAPSIELCRRKAQPSSSASMAEPEANPSVDAMDLDFDDPNSSSLSSVPSLAPSGRFPHVLISVALEESQSDLDVSKTARWLESIPFLAKWAKVEAIFQSYSTLLILSVPVPVWNMLPDNLACSFVGYIISPNLVTPLPPSDEAKPIDVPADDQHIKAASSDDKANNFEVARSQNLYKISKSPSPLSPVSGKPANKLPPLTYPARSSSGPLEKPYAYRSKQGPDGRPTSSPTVSRIYSTIQPSAIDRKWGTLFNSDWIPTKRLGQFLRGVANHMISGYPPQTVLITPSKMALYYANHALEKEPHPFLTIFRAHSSKHISQLYQDLGCEHYLIQEGPYSQPIVPSLTANGFADWMSTFILAYPEEESERLGRVVQNIPIYAANEDLVNGRPERFPSQISRHLFPERTYHVARKYLETTIQNFFVRAGSSSKHKVVADSKARRQAYTTKSSTPNFASKRSQMETPSTQVRKQETIPSEPSFDTRSFPLAPQPPLNRTLESYQVEEVA